jgi:hypothetical protein
VVSSLELFDGYFKLVANEYRTYTVVLSLEIFD